MHPRGFQVAAVVLLLPCQACLLVPERFPDPPSSRSARAGTSGARQLHRRALLRNAVCAVDAFAGVGVGALLHLESTRLEAAPVPDELSAADELFRLRSQNAMAPARKELESEWQKLREQRPAPADVQAAFVTVVRVRDAIAAAVPMAQARQWDTLSRALPATIVPDMERAATVLAGSDMLSAEQRSTIGWQWGACGWRHCGAQADAAQALSKLRANCDMLVPLEALFYLDVAKRSVDEIIAVGVSGGWLPPSAVGERKYLPRETLEMILPAEDLASGDANLPVMKGGLTEVEQSLEDYEEEQLSELQAMLSATTTEANTDDG